MVNTECGLYSNVSLILTVFTRRSLCEPCELCENASKIAYVVNRTPSCDSPHVFSHGGHCVSCVSCVKMPQKSSMW